MELKVNKDMSVTRGKRGRATELKVTTGLKTAGNGILEGVS